MRKIITPSIWAFLLVLVIANIGVFVSSIELSDKISHYEKEIEKYERENIDLEQEVVKLNSITQTASKASELGYVVKAQPVFLEKLGIAKKNQ